MSSNDRNHETRRVESKRLTEVIRRPVTMIGLTREGIRVVDGFGYG